MFELFAVGLEMQKRMIDAQMQGVEAAQKQVQTSLAAHDAGQAGMKAMKGWMNLWGMRG